MVSVWLKGLEENKGNEMMSGVLERLLDRASSE